jgi:hypothetical protein
MSDLLLEVKLSCVMPNLSRSIVRFASLPQKLLVISFNHGRIIGLTPLVVLTLSINFCICWLESSRDECSRSSYGSLISVSTVLQNCWAENAQYDYADQKMLLHQIECARLNGSVHHHAHGMTIFATCKKYFMTKIGGHVLLTVRKI